MDLRTYYGTMDPKNLPNNLDPKLQEAYERVMGTMLPTNTATPPPQAADAIPASSNGTVTQPPSQETILSQSSPQESPPPPNQTNTQPNTPQVFTPSQPFSQYVAGGEEQGANSEKSSDFPFGRIVIIIGTTVFFLLYTYFWIRFFELSVPFLSN